MQAICRQVKEGIAGIGNVLGIFTSEPHSFMERLKKRKNDTLDISVEEIEQLISERATARKAKDFKRSDEIRDYLLTRNVTLLDSPQGTTWEVK